MRIEVEVTHAEADTVVSSVRVGAPTITGG